MTGTSDTRPAIRFTAGSGKARLEATKTSMPRFADVLGEHLDRTVVDRTGLAGEYDFKLEWAQDHPGEASPSTLGTLQEELGLTGPSVFTAVQEDFGLRLEPGKGSVEIFVMDSAAKASAN